MLAKLNGNLVAAGRSLRTSGGRLFKHIKEDEILE